MEKRKRGGQLKDLTGMVFGKLTVLEYAGKKGRHTTWLCRCACGKETTVFTTSLKSGDTTSCGCANAFNKRVTLFGDTDLTGKRFGSLTVIGRKNIRSWFCRCDCGREFSRDTSKLHGDFALKCKICAAADRRMDLTGKRFGRLVAIEIEKRENKPHRNRVHWLCKCDCGNTASVVSSQLVHGKTLSCGCLVKETASRLGSQIGMRNAIGNRKYDWRVTVNGKRLTLRSSFEVIFVKYLLKHHIRFEYEPRRIQLAPDTVYIPDFHLPDTDTWVEVKGYATETWQRKRERFERAGYRLLVVTEASIASYLPGISYDVWLRRNGHKYLRNP